MFDCNPALLGPGSTVVGEEDPNMNLFLVCSVGTFWPCLPILNEPAVMFDDLFKLSLTSKLFVLLETGARSEPPGIRLRNPEGLNFVLGSADDILPLLIAEVSLVFILVEPNLNGVVAG